MPSTGSKAPATKVRDLHTSMPLWAATRQISSGHATSPARRSYDVIVVGAGISGSLCAQAMANGSRSVLVVDRREPVRGSTVASTSMIQHEIDIPLHQLIKLIGSEKAARAWRRSASSVDALVDLAQSLEIDCSMQRKHTLYLAGDEYGSRALKTEVGARDKAGVKAEFCNAARLAGEFGIDRSGAIISSMSASANPAQLAAGMLKAAQMNGAELVSPLWVTDFEETNDGVALATSEGKVLTCGHVIFASGYEFLREMESKSHQVISTWAIASEPGATYPGWIDDFLVWEGSDPYLYFRSTPDRRIIAGGEDEADPLAHKDVMKGRRKAKILAEKLNAVAGVEMGRPAYSWAAPFGTTNRGLPIIDTLIAHKRVHAVMGFGGNGITFSMIAAQILSSLIEGHADPDSDLFRFPGK